MESRNAAMQAIFRELSEKNKDIVILIARSVKTVQEEPEQSCKLPSLCMYLKISERS